VGLAPICFGEQKARPCARMRRCRHGACFTAPILFAAGRRRIPSDPAPENPLRARSRRPANGRWMPIGAKVGQRIILRVRHQHGGAATCETHGRREQGVAVGGWQRLQTARLPMVPPRAADILDNDGLPEDQRHLVGGRCAPTTIAGTAGRGTATITVIGPRRIVLRAQPARRRRYSRSQRRPRMTMARQTPILDPPIFGAS